MMCYHHLCQRPDGTSLLAFEGTFACVWGAGLSLPAMGAAVGAVLQGGAEPNVAADPALWLGSDSQGWLSGEVSFPLLQCSPGSCPRLLHGSSVSWHIAAAADALIPGSP